MHTVDGIIGTAVSLFFVKRITCTLVQQYNKYFFAVMGCFNNRYKC